MSVGMQYARMNKEAKALLDDLKIRQFAGEHLPCPRCGKDNMDQDNVRRNALSRQIEIYICNECGIEESIDDWTGRTPLPFRKWAYPASVAKGE